MEVIEIEPNISYIYRLSQTIKFLAIIDGLLAFLAFFYNSWLAFMGIGAIAGYIGAKAFNSYCTLVYQILIALGRISFVIYNCIQVDNWPISLIIWTSLMCLLELYIARFVLKFYYKLTKLTTDQLHQLTHYEAIPIGVVYW